MLLAVMQHVAALAEGLQVPRAAIARIMVEMGRREIDSRRCALPRVDRQPREGPALPAAPMGPLLVVPSAVAEMAHGHAMWATTALAAPFGTLEADQCRELRPVDRV